MNNTIWKDWETEQRQARLRLIQPVCPPPNNDNFGRLGAWLILTVAFCVAVMLIFVAVRLHQHLSEPAPVADVYQIRA